MDLTEHSSVVVVAVKVGRVPTEPDEITSVEPDDDIHTLMIYGCLIDIVASGESGEGYSS